MGIGPHVTPRINGGRGPQGGSTMKSRFSFLDTIQGEPSLRDLLEDPVTHKVMARDRLTLRDVMAACRDGRQRLARAEAARRVPHMVIVGAGWGGPTQPAMPGWPGACGL